MSATNQYTLTDRIFAYICEYKAAFDGLSPSSIEIAIALDSTPNTVTRHIVALISEGRITIPAVRGKGFMVNGARWFYEGAETLTETPALELTPLPAELDTPIPDDPDLMHDMIIKLRQALNTARTEAYQIKRDNDRLRNRARGTNAIQADLDRANSDNARMNADLTQTYATALKWQKEAQRLKKENQQLQRDISSLERDVDNEVSYWKTRSKNSAHLLEQTRRKLNQVRAQHALPVITGPVQLMLPAGEQRTDSVLLTRGG